MENVILIVVCLLGIHWFADFVCQTRWQAENKSKNWDALLEHVTFYTALLGVGTMELAFIGFPFVWLGFVFFNGFAHFITDAITSRITAYFYSKGDIHSFFVVIGLDQLIHQTTLILTLYLFVLRGMGYE
jgi:hypothetical protein